MIENLVKNLLDKLILEIKKEENQQKIEFEILTPVLMYYKNKLYPYIILLLLLYIINLIIIILFFIIMFNQKNKILN